MIVRVPFQVSTSSFLLCFFLFHNRVHARAPKEQPVESSSSLAMLVPSLISLEALRKMGKGGRKRQSLMLNQVEKLFLHSLESLMKQKGFEVCEKSRKFIRMKNEKENEVNS